MDDILRDIQDVAGVTGCFVADGTGKLVKSTLPGVFDPASLTTVSKTLAKTIEGLRMARRKKATELDLVFEQGRLVAKVMSGGYLFILCVPSINLPLLNLTANVAAKKLSALMAPPAPKPAPAAGVAAAPAVVAAPKVEVVPQLEAIVGKAMGKDGLELFREELAGISQDSNPTRTALEALAQSLYFPATLAVGGGTARKMVDSMLEVIQQGG